MKKSVSQIGSQIEVLSKANAELNDKFVNLLKTHSQQVSVKPSEFSASTATTIADELAERDRKKNNVIVYNFPEGSDLENEKQCFVALCKDFAELDVSVQKYFRIGRKEGNKTRHALVSFDTESAKLAVLAKAPKLRFDKKFNKVYISPDMTRFERTKHRKLVVELKRRREQGERNLIIKNWSIVQRQPRRPYPTSASADVPLATASSDQPMLSDPGSHQS